MPKIVNKSCKPAYSKYKIPLAKMLKQVRMTKQKLKMDKIVEVEKQRFYCIMHRDH